MIQSGNNVQESRHLASFRAVVIPPVSFPVRTNVSHPKKPKDAAAAVVGSATGVPLTPSADKAGLRKVC